MRHAIGDWLGLDVTGFRVGLAVTGAEVGCKVTGYWLGLDVTGFRVGLAVTGIEVGLTGDWLGLDVTWLAGVRGGGGKPINNLVFSCVSIVYAEVVIKQNLMEKNVTAPNTYSYRSTRDLL